ncbi:MRP-L47-domain-containing protein [Artomyces pyxidatus]|uniref:MRP-L47-domain-containing protein n=1 Tax=Artomyces pyxidatus TaxID=48021 RepID=A0ACB8SJY1_9AGAM|nr:MRP-L47-domain-containing protein [Artomyces pyxidatus]
MLSAFRSRSLRAFTAVRPSRYYSTVIDTVVTPTPTPQKAEGALRPHLGIPVNPNHGLYAFFRKKEIDGEITYQSLDNAVDLREAAGRSWSAAELRRKSFRDLHTLWYVLLRERNLLATQREEVRRISGRGGGASGIVGKRVLQCRKSMARIKYVINERRLAYQGAVEIFATKQFNEELRDARKSFRRPVRPKPKEQPAKPVSDAAQLAADSLLQTQPIAESS